MKIDKRYKLIGLFLVLLSVVRLTLFFKTRESFRPNILLITIDALRPDHLGCYGYKRNTTPCIDRIAKDGVMFTQAISQASVTIVSFASLLTSVYPTRHGIITQHLDIHKDFLYPTIIEILKRDHYKTATFLSPASAIEIPPWAKRSVDYVFQSRYKKKSSPSFDADLLSSAALKWIKSNRIYPFFVWIHYFNPHVRYTPPPPYNKLYVKDKFYNSDIRAPFVDNLEGRGGIPPDANLNNIQEVDYYIAQYDGEIKYTDYCIGKLLRYFRKEGIYNDCLIVILADHGESLGEHNIYFEHACTLYDGSLRVPLIIKFPKGDFKGKIISQQVRAIDIMPTILEYLNLEVPNSIDGESLLGLLHGKSKYYATFSFSKTAAMDAIRNQEWKLIYYENNNKYYELYNLKDDPRELNNLVSVEKEQFTFLKHKLDDFMKQASYQNKEIKPILDEEARERLRSLGYIQ